MKIFLILVSFFFIMACSSSEQVSVKDDAGKTNPYDESFDPNTLNDDDIEVNKLDNSPVAHVSNQGTSQAAANPVYTEVMGFRVQLIATKSIETATLADQEAKDLFASMNHRTYLIFEPPLYKIRVGDVRTRDEAEGIKDVAKDYGYREAFIVPTKVNIAKDNPQ
jgi:SPOR domain